MTDTAIANAIETESPLVEWTINYKGNSFTLEDVTGEHLFNLSVLLGDSWTAMTPLTGPMSLMSFVSVMQASKTGQQFNEVFEELKALKAEELLSLIDVSPIS